MNKKDLYILMLEDEPLDADLNKAQLALLEEYNCIVHITADKDSFLQALNETTPDIILSDYNLPQYTGLEALNDLKKSKPLIPFIFVTGTLDEETAAGTIKAGAWDYVVKDRLFRLPLAVRSVLELKKERLLATEAEEKVNRLLAAIDQTSSQIIVTNTGGIIEYVNKRFAEVTGYQPEEVTGKDIGILSDNSTKKTSLASIIGSLKKNEVFRGEVQTKTQDGKTIWEWISVTPIFNPDKTLMNFVTVMEDITQRKVMEQQLVDALDKAERSDKLKDAFLQNMSHEIRTPLNAIVGFSEILNNMEEKTPEKIKEFTSIINDSSHQLLAIVNNVLTVASIQTGHESIVSKPLDLYELMKQIFSTYSRIAVVKKLEFKVIKHIKYPSFHIITDETKLTQILNNILDNAIKFTHSGFVHLEYSINDNNQIIFKIKDSGIGIPKHADNIIFERFQQADPSIHINYGGAGLGLTIAKSFSQMLGGNISFESEPGTGSTFTLTLPYKPAGEPPDHIKMLKQDGKNRRITVLAAEDEIYNFLLIKAILRNFDINLLHAENGLDAIKICKDNHTVDLVLMDIKMPEMDGIAAFKEIRKINSKLPVIAVTAYALEQEKQNLLKLGFNDYMSKPIKKDELLKKIKEQLQLYQEI
ncbi:MAG: response regulator [Bacteroidales bacterium]|nr:response regulator [Bacteroidales bacterium]